MTNKVFIVGRSPNYVRMFQRMGWIVTDNMFDAHLVQFTGGEDVTPAIYGQSRHPATHSSLNRDVQEAGVYKICRLRGIPMAGICRGGQFLNVMSGGRMFQDVNNHAIGGTHKATDLETSTVVDVTSTHHQMMVAGKNGEVLCVATLATRREYDDFEGPDTEVVFYRDDKVLCFQPHPEYNEPTEDYYFRLLDRCFGL